MKAKLTKIKDYQKGKSFNNMGTYFMTYKNKDYYSGDVIIIYDEFQVPYHTIIVEENNKVYAYGFFYASIGGNLDPEVISDIELYKSYKDLKDGEEIFGFKIEINELDNLNTKAMTKSEMNSRLSAEFKLDLLEMDMAPYLEKLLDERTTKDQRKIITGKLHELGKDYVILYDIVQEHKYIKKNKDKMGYLDI